MLKQNLIFKEYISNRNLPKNYEELFQNHILFQEKTYLPKDKIYLTQQETKFLLIVQE